MPERMSDERLAQHERDLRGVADLPDELVIGKERTRQIARDSLAIIDYERATLQAAERVSGSDRATVSGGDGATVSGGDWATVSGGNWATVSGGNWATVSGGNWATVSGGYGATVSGGDRATVSGGAMGELHVRYWDSKAGRYRTAIGYVGEDGIESNVAYRCDKSGKLVKAAAEKEAGDE